MAVPTVSSISVSVRTDLTIPAGFMPSARSRPNSRMRSKTAIRVVLTIPKLMAIKTTTNQRKIKTSYILRMAVTSGSNSRQVSTS